MSSCFNFRTDHYEIPTLAQQFLYLACPGSTASTTSVQACPEVTASHAKIISYNYCAVCRIILSCASEMGSPTNHLGSRQRQDTGQGSFSPLINYQKLKKMDRPLDPFYYGRVSLARHNINYISQYIAWPC